MFTISELTISEVVKTWKTDIGGRSIAPAGILWCREGNRVYFGNNVKIGRYVTIGNNVILYDDVTIGKDCTLDNNVRLDHHVTLGDYVRLDHHVTLGNNVTLGDYVKIDSHVVLGYNYELTNAVVFVMDIGIQSNYRHTLIKLDNGEFRFVGGCHMFTFNEAKKYWKGKENRKDTLLAVEFAEKIAKNH